MKVNMAVYTAVHGFDWQPGTVFERRELNRFYEMIGDFPDIMMQKVPFGGAFVCDGRFVFYRFHVNVHGDSRGRDALYCVVGAVPVEDAPRLDLAQVMTAPEFAGPVKPFPVGMIGKEIAPAGTPKTRRELQSRVDAIAGLNDIGSCAAHYSRGSFVCRITESEGRFVFKVQCENPDIVDPPPPPPPVERPAELRKEIERPREIKVRDMERENRLERELLECRERCRKLESELVRARHRIDNYVNSAVLAVALALVAFAVAFFLRGCDSSPDCETCKGTGKVEVEEMQNRSDSCKKCAGKGAVRTLNPFSNKLVTCSDCMGRGSVPRQVKIRQRKDCPTCGGTGKMPEPKSNDQKAKAQGSVETTPRQ